MGIGELSTQIAPYLIYACSALILMLSIVKPRIGVLFLIPILPLDSILQKMNALPLGKDFVDIFIIALLIGLLFNLFSRQDFHLEHSALNLPLLMLVFYTYISLHIGNSYLKSIEFMLKSWLPDIQYARMQTWKNYIVLPIIYFLVLNSIREKKHLKWLLFIMIAIIFLMSLKFFRNYRWIDKSFFRDEMRWSGTFTYLGPNEYSAFFSHYVFIILGLFLTTKSRLKQLLFALTITFNLYCIVFLFSRGSYLATIFAFGLAGIIRKNIPIIVLITVLLVSWHTLLPKAVTERILMTQTDDNGLEYSADSRIRVWKGSMKLFYSSPLAGIGFNTFPYLGFELGDAHNVYVKMLVEQGIAGLLIFLFIIFIALFYALRLYSRARDDLLKGLGLGFFLCTISLLVSNFFGDRWSYVPLNAYYWAFLALVVRGNIIVNEELKRERSAKRKK